MCVTKDVGTIKSEIKDHGDATPLASRAISKFENIIFILSNSIL